RRGGRPRPVAAAESTTAAGRPRRVTSRTSRTTPPLACTRAAGAATGTAPGPWPVSPGPAPEPDGASLDDIGSAAAAAIAEPERFDGVELELAGDRRTMAEIADILSRVCGTELTAPDMTEEEAVAAGMSLAGHGQASLNDHPQPADPAYARALGLPTTDFETWARTRFPVAA
ncbi:NmrA family NAD(P)-binding protein, partial [Streptomyces sp. C1-2]|uniref:NmrA family NAD(P)-binding protein n=1 Tax=Streptomyces sp. C1-2 TaxID=2720022 RepID=UPI003211E110